MKTKLFLLALIMMSFAFYSCNDDDNMNVSKEFEGAFNSLYPDAKNVSWERKGNYFVADFWRTEMGVEAEAWFTNNAEWQMTVTEIVYSALPQTVKRAFEGSDYSRWHLDDTDMIERHQVETVYVIEVKKGDLEYDLYFTADGTLIKEVVDNNNNSNNNDFSHYVPVEISSVISEFINRQYPNAKIIEIEKEGNAIEVDIRDANIHRELLFDAKGEWLYTKTEVILMNIPEAIMSAFKNSQYANWRIDEIDYFDTPEKDFYIFELDSEPEDTYLKIYTDGTMELVVRNIR